MRLVGADVSADCTSSLIASCGPRSRKDPLREYNVSRSFGLNLLEFISFIPIEFSYHLYRSFMYFISF